jgi:5-methylcytosine-specific restriction endonuclease McrA
MGNLSKRRRATIAEQGGWKCYLCPVALTPDTLTIDHLVPKSHGGDDSEGNLKPCCRPCNRKKQIWEARRKRVGKPITRSEIRIQR